MKTMRILVPRLLDRDNYNAQNLNAKALLSRFSSDDCTWIGLHYGEPDKAVFKNRRVKLVSLWRRRLWLMRMWLLYMQPADALFYPGIEAVDLAGVRWRKKMYPHCPIIATLEGLAGTKAREKQLTDWADHPVYCQPVDQRTMERIDAILDHSDHIIAISPFMAEMGRRLYGDKFSVLPLGIETSIFYPSIEKSEGRKRVVSVGRLEARKRPELFLTLAENFPEADFIWYGDGSLRRALIQEAKSRRLKNIDFPGALCPSELADEFRRANLFVMPSASEGVPKVTQEAAACGLPQVVFGYYETPSVVDGKNGFVVWSDDEFISKVGCLLDDSSLAKSFGLAGSEMAKHWDWNLLAPQWEAAIRSAIARQCSR